MKFSNSKKQTKNPELTSTTTTTPAHLPFSNDQLIRKMCHQMLQHDSNTEQSPKPPSASSGGSLLNKMHRHRKLVHQHRGARSVSPSHKKMSATGQRLPTTTTTTAPFLKHTDDSMTSRVFGKRFKSPTSSSGRDMGYSSSSVDQQQQRSEPDDFLRYKSSASLYCFGKGVRGSNEEDFASSFSFDTQSSAASSVPRKIETQQQILQRHRQVRADIRSKPAPYDLPGKLQVRDEPIRRKPSYEVRADEPIRRKPASYTLPGKLQVRDEPRRKPSYTLPGKLEVRDETILPKPSYDDEVRDGPPTHHRRKPSYNTLPGKLQVRDEPLRRKPSYEARDEPIRRKPSYEDTQQDVVMRAGPTHHRRKPSYDLGSSQRYSPFRVESRDDDDESKRRPSPIPRSLCFSPSPAAMEEEMKRAEQRKTTTPKNIFPVRTIVTPNKVLSSTSGAFRQVVPSSRGSTSSDAEKQQPRALRHSPRHRRTETTPSSTAPLVLRGSSSMDGSVVSTPPPLTDLGALRLKYAEEFVREIELYRTGERSSPDPPPTTTTNSSKSGLSVFIRKRPMLAGEREMGDFDVMRVVKDGKSKQSCSAATVFRTNVTSDKETKLIQPLCFGGGFTGVFDASVENDRVYRAAVKPLVRCVTLHHKAAALLVCGQMGSGKRYTMSSCQKLLATEIFSSAHSRGVVHEVQCLELVGKSCFDLLNPETSRVTVVDTEDGGVNLQGAQKVNVKSTRELVSVFTECEDRRRAGRSHVIYQIRCSRGTAALGLLTLVSCASNERACSKALYDADVNASMFALKECMRVRMRTNSRVPYRASNLTRVLRECLEKEGSEIAVIGTISPKATDTENSISTLKLTSGLVGAQWQEGDSRKINSKMITEKAQLSPKDWDHQDLVSWLSKRDLIGRKRIPSYLNGKAVMKMSRIQLESTLYSGDANAEEKSTRLFRSLRHESERVMRSDLRRKMTMVGLAN